MLGVYLGLELSTIYHQKNMAVIRHFLLCVDVLGTCLNTVCVSPVNNGSCAQGFSERGNMIRMRTDCSRLPQMLFLCTAVLSS